MTKSKIAPNRKLANIKSDSTFKCIHHHLLLLLLLLLSAEMDNHHEIDEIVEVQED